MHTRTHLPSHEKSAPQLCSQCKKRPQDTLYNQINVTVFVYICCIINLACWRLTSCTPSREQLHQANLTILPNTNTASTQSTLINWLMTTNEQQNSHAEQDSSKHTDYNITTNNLHHVHSCTETERCGSSMHGGEKVCVLDLRYLNVLVYMVHWIYQGYQIPWECTAIF